MKGSEYRVLARILTVAIGLVAAMGSVAVEAADGVDLDLFVSTDAMVYAPGDLVSIDVQAIFSDGSPVASPGRSSVTITDSNNKRQFRSELDFNGNGAFSSAYTLGPSAREGTWQVKGRLDVGGGDRTTATTAFQVSDDPTGCADAVAPGAPPQVTSDPARAPDTPDWPPLGPSAPTTP